MTKIIVVVAALAVALAGCGNVEIRSPFVTKPLPQPAAQKATPVATAASATTQAVKSPSAPAPVVASETFDPGVLSAEQKAQNLKKCQGWGKLSAAEKKKKGFFCWQKVGADPYQGKAEAALAQSNWPAEVQQLFLNQIRLGNKAEMVLERGMTFDWSTFGKGVSKAFVHRNVVADWKEGEAHSASVRTVSHGGKIYKLYLPRDCGNWSGNVYSVPTQAPPRGGAPAPAPLVRTPIGSCPNGYSVILNIRALDKMPPGLREEALRLIKAASKRLSQNATRLDVYQPDDVSRTLHHRLLDEVELTAPVTADIQIRYLDTQTGMLVRELGIVHLVDGAGIYQFLDDPRKYVVEIIWPAYVISPTISGGLHRMRIFPWEWVVCAPYAHSIVPYSTVH